MLKVVGGRRGAPPTGSRSSNSDGSPLLTVVGVSYHQAPVELRELVAVSPNDLDSALRSLGNAVILTTCNRTEIYQDLPDPEASCPGREFLLDRAGVYAAEFAACLYTLTGEAAVRHLCFVAAGLDSMVIGEAQILGQIREALDAATLVATTTPVLVHAFHDALRVGRRARAETFIGRHAVSVSYAAVELARVVFGRLDGLQAVVVGAGETGELTARTLVEHGVTISAVANRTVEHAQQLVSRFGGHAVGLGDLPNALVAADILISATDAPGYVVTREAIATATEARPTRPLFLVDIAVPRDVDPACAELPNVVLYGIDDLKAHCNANRDRRSKEASRVRAIVDDEVGRFLNWERTRTVLPTVIALREWAEGVRRAELAEARSRLRQALQSANGGDSTNIEGVVEDLSRALVNKLLHDPTVRLKANPDDPALRGAIGALFDLGPL